MTDRCARCGEDEPLDEADVCAECREEAEHGRQLVADFHAALL